MNKIGVLLQIFIFFTEKAGAFSVSPMTANFHPSGEQASVVYTVTNPSDQAVAIEIKVQARSTAIDGKEINDPEVDVKKLFTIFPAATLVMPNQKKGIRVVYIGPKDLDIEKVYRVNIIEKPPKQAGSDSAGVRFMREFRTTAYVTPKNSKPGLKITSVSETTSGKLNVQFSNEGSGHQLTQKMSLKISDEIGNVAEVSEKTEEKLLTNFLAGEKRSFDISKPSLLKGKAFKVTIESVE